MNRTERLINAFEIEKVTTEKFRRDLKRCLGGNRGEDVLSYLEKKFSAHLPAFQGGKGQYDPLDAMRRDAYREVFLFVRRELSLAPTSEDEQETD